MLVMRCVPNPYFDMRFRVVYCAQHYGVRMILTYYADTVTSVLNLNAGTDESRRIRNAECGICPRGQDTACEDGPQDSCTVLGTGET